MTQIATVERILDDTHAEISVPRKSACGHDCEECAGCGVSGVSVYVKALNTVGARPGQKVVVESDTKKMLKIVSFVYLIPVILFLAGYLIMLACSTSVAVQYTAAVAGAVLGILLAIWYDRRVQVGHNGSDVLAKSYLVAPLARLVSSIYLFIPKDSFYSTHTRELTDHF